jgi:hypothetical protein
VYYESNNKTDTSLWQLRNREISWAGSLCKEMSSRINWYQADDMGKLVNEPELVEGLYTLLSPAAGE